MPNPVNELIKKYLNAELENEGNRPLTLKDLISIIVITEHYEAKMEKERDTFWNPPKEPTT